MSLKKTLNKLNKGQPLTIVALGDSLTHGWMVEKGYIDFLQEMLPKKYPMSKISMINQGIPGDTALGGMYRTDSEVLYHDPDLVFIQFALNDAFSNHSPETYKQNIQSIVEKIQNSSEAEIMLITSVFMENKHDYQIVEKFYNALIDISEDYNISIALVHKYWEMMISRGIVFNSLVQTDQVHPTEKGYKLMAEAIMEVFELNAK